MKEEMDERLKEAKKLISKYNDMKKSDFMVLTDHGVNVIEYLIQQAEEKQGLEDIISSHALEGRNYTNAQYVDLLQENQKLKQSLLKLEQSNREMNKHQLELRRDAKDWYKVATQFEDKIFDYIDVLEFYANKKNQKLLHGIEKSPYEIDGGKKARQILGEGNG